MTLEAPPPKGETENSPRSVGTEPITPAPPSNSSGSAQSTQQPFQLTGSKTEDAENTPHVVQPPATSEGKLTGLSKELLQLQKEMNTALEELLEVTASMDYCHRELDVGQYVIMMPSLPKPRHAMQPQLLPCNRPT